jgi:hypothetical protein
MKNKPLIILFLLILNSKSLLGQSSYNVNLNTLSFLNANRNNIVGTGRAVGDIVHYTSVITIGGQAIDCIVTTKSISNGTFTLPGNPGANTTAFDYHTATGTGMSANEDRFFSPTFNWNSGGGSCNFEFQFILGGGSISPTNLGTKVILQNVYVNSYDIDGNGGTNSNQFNEYRGFNSSQYVTTGGNVQTTYNTSNGLTKFRSSTNTNIPTVTDPATRVRVYYENLSTFNFIVGAEGSGPSYYFIEFGAGPTWTAPTIDAPKLDLNTVSTGLNNTGSISVCNTYTSFTNGGTNITSTSSVNNIFIQFNNTQILDGSSEILNINGATNGANIALNFSNNASIAQVTHSNINYNVTASRVGNISKLTFTPTSSSTITAAQAETFVDALRYTNTNCNSTNAAERLFDVSIREGAFESVIATFLVDVLELLPIDEIELMGNYSTKGNLLNWNIYNENIQFINLYKSTHQKSWTLLAKLNNQSINFFIDSNNASNSNFYFLEIIRFDGSKSKSNLIRISSNKNNEVAVYPNPSNQFITYTNNDNLPFDYQIVDSKGSVIQKGYSENPFLNIELNKGVYILIIKSELNNQQHKLIIQ